MTPSLPSSELALVLLKDAERKGSRGGLLCALNLQSPLSLCLRDRWSQQEKMSEFRTVAYNGFVSEVKRANRQAKKTQERTAVKKRRMLKKKMSMGVLTSNSKQLMDEVETPRQLNLDRIDATLYASDASIQSDDPIQHSSLYETSLRRLASLPSLTTSWHETQQRKVDDIRTDPSLSAKSTSASVDDKAKELPKADFFSSRSDILDEPVTVIPVDVSCTIFSIDRITTKENTFTVDVWVRAQWCDPNLKSLPTIRYNYGLYDDDAEIQIPPNAWTPKLVFANAGTQDMYYYPFLFTG